MTFELVLYGDNPMLPYARKIASDEDSLVESGESTIDD